MIMNRAGTIVYDIRDSILCFYVLYSIPIHGKIMGKIVFLLPIPHKITYKYGNKQQKRLSITNINGCKHAM